MSLISSSLGLCLAILMTVTTSQAIAETGDADKSTLADKAPSTILLSQVADRNFGYVIGDLLVQRVTLPEKMPLPDISALTPVSRVSTWLERQGATLQPLKNGRHELTIRYQVINAPSRIVQAALPELWLGNESAETKMASENNDILIQAWPFTLGPLTATRQTADNTSGNTQNQPADQLPLRPDHSLPALDSQTPAARLKLNLLLLGCTLLAWLSWFVWRRQRDIVRLPFANAAQLLKQQTQPSLPDSNSESAWQILHHAFNQSGGQVITRRNLPSLYVSQPWLEVQSSQILAFFEASAARHFELPSREESFALEPLARSLATAEKKHSD